MSFRTWLYVFAIGLVTLPSMGMSQEDIEGAENSPNSPTSQETTQAAPNLLSALEGIEGAIRDLIREESEGERQHIADQAAQDLEAQTEMAQWAMEMAIAAIASAFFTFGGLVLIWRTLIVGDRTLVATRKMAVDQKRIGEAQVRAYLHCAEAAFDIAQQEFVTAILTITNTGQSPASDVSVVGECIFENVGGFPHMPRVLESAQSLTSDMQGDPVPSQGEGTYRILFDAVHLSKSIGADYTGFEGKDGVKEILESANRIVFYLKFSWSDVFGSRHSESIALNAGINKCPYYPSVRGKRNSGDLEFSVEGQ